MMIFEMPIKKTAALFEQKTKQTHVNITPIKTPALGPHDQRPRILIDTSEESASSSEMEERQHCLMLLCKIRDDLEGSKRSQLKMKRSLLQRSAGPVSSYVVDFVQSL